MPPNMTMLASVLTFQTRSAWSLDTDSNKLGSCKQIQFTPSKAQQFLKKKSTEILFQSFGTVSISYGSGSRSGSRVLKYWFRCRAWFCKNRSLDPGQNADPDTRTLKMLVQCESGSKTLILLPWDETWARWWRFHVLDKSNSILKGVYYIKIKLAVT